MKKEFVGRNWAELRRKAWRVVGLGAELGV